MNNITTNNLKVGYEKKVILDNVNIEIPKGKITVIIGANGSGKSTLLKALGRLIKPFSGEIYLDGLDINKLQTREVAKKLAILPQTPVAPSGLSVRELVEYGRFPHSSRKVTEEDKEIIRWALKSTKLDDLEMSELDKLSGGQRQRAWIAMAIAQKTDSILLDEPTTYLDMAYQLEVLDVLKKLNSKEKHTIVMVLHDINLAAKYADYIISIKEGRIIKTGSPEVIMETEVLRDTFNIKAEIGRDSKYGKPVCISYDLV